MEHITQTKASLQSKFEMADMGLLHFFLGLEIWQDQSGIFISQKRYVQELLQAFDMQDCRPISTPMDPNQKLSAHDDGELVDASLYRKLVGSLIWLLNTRLDISFPVGLLAGFMSKWAAEGGTHGQQRENARVRERHRDCLEGALLQYIDSTAILEGGIQRPSLGSRC